MTDPQDSKYEPAVTAKLENLVRNNVGEDGLCMFDFAEVRDAVITMLEAAQATPAPETSNQNKEQ